MNDSQINGAGNRPSGIDGFHTHERECFPGVRANQTDGKCEDILERLDTYEEEGS